MKAWRITPDEAALINEQPEQLHREAQRKTERWLLCFVILFGLVFATLMFLPLLFS